MTQITRNGFVNKNGEKVVLNPAPHTHTIANVNGLQDELSARAYKSGVTDLTEEVRRGYKLNYYPKLYIYNQDRAAEMIYVSGSGSRVKYKFGKFSFSYIKSDEGTSTETEFLTNKTLDEFAEKMPTDVNILLHIGVYESNSLNAKTILPAIFIKYAGTPETARIYVGNIIFRFTKTSGHYTADSGGYTESNGDVYDITHLLSSGENYVEGERLIGGSPIFPITGSTTTFGIHTNLANKLKAGDVVRLSGDDSDYDKIRKVAYVDVPNASVTFDFVEEPDEQEDMIPSELLSNITDEDQQSIAFYLKVRTSAYGLLGEKADRDELRDALNKISLLEHRVAALEPSASNS